MSENAEPDYEHEAQKIGLMFAGESPEECARLTPKLAKYLRKTFSRPSAALTDEEKRTANNLMSHLEMEGETEQLALVRRLSTRPAVELLSGGALFKAAAGQLAQEIAECRRLHCGRAGGQSMPAPTKGQQLLEIALLETPVQVSTRPAAQDLREAEREFLEQAVLRAKGEGDSMDFNDAFKKYEKALAALHPEEQKKPGCAEKSNESRCLLESGHSGDHRFMAALR